jgi:hypothetical protein
MKRVINTITIKQLLKTAIVLNALNLIEKYL